MSFWGNGVDDLNCYIHARFLYDGTTSLIRLYIISQPDKLCFCIISLVWLSHSARHMNAPMGCSLFLSWNPLMVKLSLLILPSRAVLSIFPGCSKTIMV